MLSETCRYISEPQSLNTLDFKKYGRHGVIPPLDFKNLELWIPTNMERAALDVHTGGDFSYVLLYRQRPAFVMSYKVKETDLWVIQLQGVKKIGWRVNTGMDVARLFADQTITLVSDPENPVFKRVLQPFTILGIDEDQKVVEARKEGISSKYKSFRELMGMVPDQQIGAYVLNISNVQSATN